MRYYSTRDGRVDDCGAVDFEGALFSGYASDGGLFAPRDLPALDWRKWAKFSYKEIVADLMKVFVDDDRIRVEDIVNSAYSLDNFGHPDVVGLAQPCKDQQLYLVELFHGPTWSFKDFALQTVVRLLQAYLEINKKRLTLIAVTSGDTGTAAIEAVKQCSNIDIIVMYPRGKVAPTQERQMTSVMAENVHVFGGEGVFDELASVIRTIYADPQYVQKHNLGTINSVNWARIMVQMAHWIYGYMRVMAPRNRVGEQLTFAIPTGGAGNICGALYAKKMGVPLNIVLCSNENGTLDTWIRTGRLEYLPVRNTLASAMDINKPVNIERIVHLMAYENESCAEKAARVVSDFMGKFHTSGRSKTPADLEKKVQQTMSSCTVTDGQIESTMKEVYTETAYLCCPHTATAVHYALTHPKQRPIVCAATAAHYKFNETIDRLGIPAEHCPKLEKLEKAAVKHCGTLRAGEDWVAVIKRKIEEISIRHQ